jgi:hypothetical protein
MKKLVYLSLCGAVGVFAAFAISPAQAQSAKTVAGVKDLSVITVNNDPGTPHTLMELSLHTAQQKDLLITVSAQCNLFTKTTVKNKSDGSSDTASATARLGVQVTIDGVAALPSSDGAQMIDANGDLVNGPNFQDFVTFCQRSQTLTATLGQGLVNCTVTAGVVGGAGCTLTDQEVTLLLSTLNAHSFTFIAPWARRETDRPSRRVSSANRRSPSRKSASFTASTFNSKLALRGFLSPAGKPAGLLLSEGVGVTSPTLTVRDFIIGGVPIAGIETEAIVQNTRKLL